MISTFVRFSSRSLPSSGPPGGLPGRDRGTVAAGGEPNEIGSPNEIGAPKAGDDDKEPGSVPFDAPPPKSIDRPPKGFASSFFSRSAGTSSAGVEGRVSSGIARHPSTAAIPPGGIVRSLPRRRVTHEDGRDADCANAEPLCTPPDHLLVRRRRLDRGRPGQPRLRGRRQG